MQPLADNAISIPAFLSKLWKMVNDPSTDHLICWSSAGNSFYIQNQAQFWYKLLPLYYKHNNMSSFVRQLNMYGFHKMSSYENGTMDADKDEIQFFHPYFQRDQPELLKLIKRKVTPAKHTTEHSSSGQKIDDLKKVLDDVKQIRGKQASVDTQLSEMKHENAVLWRELAVLRQKHLKQQQIVNKLIQFLVTCVQPRINGVLLKRRYPLMINESPPKKAKSSSTTQASTEGAEGPTIHELDTAEALTNELLIEDDNDPLIQVPSPTTPQSTSTVASSGKVDDELSPPAAVSGAEETSDLFWDSPEFIYIKPEELLSQTEDAEVIKQLQLAEEGGGDETQQVFLNSTTQDMLLSNLTNGSYNKEALSGNGKAGESSSKKDVEAPAGSATAEDNAGMTVATRDPVLGLNKLNSATLGTNDCYREDLDLHLESTQSELDQLKDILNGCNTLDANTLLGKETLQFFQLFNDESPDYGLCYTREPKADGQDPLVSGSELAMYDSGADMIDFSELFDESTDGQDLNKKVQSLEVEPQSTVNTPLVEEVIVEPAFPVVKKKK